MNIFNIFKFFILLTIFLICMYIGKLQSKKYVYRLKELECIYGSLSIFKTKLKFTYEPLLDIFLSIANQTKLKNISDIFNNTCLNIKNNSASKAWEMTIDQATNINLNNEDKVILKTMSKLLRTN